MRFNIKYCVGPVFSGWGCEFVKPPYLRMTKNDMEQCYLVNSMKKVSNTVSEAFLHREILMDIVENMNKKYNHLLDK